MEDSLSRRTRWGSIFRQLLSCDDVADDVGGGFEAPLPAGPGAIAHEEIFWVEARGHNHGACYAMELAPAGGDTDEIGGVLGQIALQIGLKRHSGSNPKLRFRIAHNPTGAWDLASN